MEKKLVSPGGYTDAYGPNVSQILAQSTRVIRGKVPRSVRAELAAAVRDGVLGRLKKDGLKPEIYFHPDHKNGAIDLQKREAIYAAGCISKVMVPARDLTETDLMELANAKAKAIAKATGQ